MKLGTSPYTVVTDPAAYAGIPLAAEDNQPIDSDWHRDCMMLLIAVIVYHFRRRDGWWVGGNNFIYFNPEQARNLDYRGPDFFFIKDGVDRSRLRRYWAVWEEGGRLPDVIIELLSPTTEAEDRTTKHAIYEQTLRTPEYFLYDPDSQTLEGYRLVRGQYQPITPNRRGWLWSEELQLWLGTWEGTFLGQQATWLRFYSAKGKLVLHGEEAEQQRAGRAQRRADREKERAEQAKQRAERAEAELARLRALLAEKGISPPNGNRPGQ